MTTATTTRVLVCPPTHFGVEYVINPWMTGNIGAVHTASAHQQWQALVNILSAHSEVSVIDPHPGLPDMCFVANGGFALGRAFVPATFAVSQRIPESALFRTWASGAGYQVVELEDDHPFEGEGDALWWPVQACCGLAMACAAAWNAIAPWRSGLRVRVASLHLVDARFYHLDTCFAALPNGRVVYYPAAFDQRSRRLVESLAPSHSRIEIGDEDALNFACNAVRLGNRWISHYASDALLRRLEEWGFEVTTTPLGEFIKAGGAAKCLTLMLDQDVPDDFENRPPARSSIRVETVEMEGHLLDANALPRTFELVSEAGGSVRLERFRGGARADQTSHCASQGERSGSATVAAHRTGAARTLHLTWWWLPPPTLTPMPLWASSIAPAWRRTTSAAAPSILPMYASLVAGCVCVSSAWMRPSAYPPTPIPQPQPAC